MKNILKRLLPLAVLPFLTGCVTGTTKVLEDKTNIMMSTSNVNSTEIYLSCQQATGYIIYQILLSEDTALTIKGEVKISGGSVSFQLMEMSDKEIFSQSIDSNSNFEIPLTQTGNYKLKIDHNSFKGSYKLNWAK